MLMLVPAVTLFLLYLFRPRPYVLAGVTCVGGRQRDDAGAQLRFGRPHPADGPEHGLGRPRSAWRRGRSPRWCSARALRFASAWFRAPAVFSRRMYWTFVDRRGVDDLGAAIYLGPPAVVGPAFVLMSLCMARAAITYFAVARRERMVGAAA